MSYEIKLPLFEGPFDLLLFFIERDELDIYDIPIYKLTSDFLDYLQHLEKLNMELASEFIFVASTLMSIKAKMLLPRQELDEKGNEIDPREELVRHLLEYKKYKSVIGELVALETNRMDREKRANVAAELKAIAEKNNLELEMQDTTLFKLLRIYEKALGKFELEKTKPIHRVVQYPYTIDEQKEQILNLLAQARDYKISFEEVITFNREKIAVIYNFLAILELLQLNLISIHIGLGYNNFWIEQGVNNEVTQEQES